MEINSKHCKWLVLALLTVFAAFVKGDLMPEPDFSAAITNVTTPVGREAILACTVHNLSTYKVAWLRVDTQTILTIHSHVITKSRRVGVTHSDHRTWFLHVREVRESDRGWYMCQINTDPMKSQVGYLDVVVPPDILDRGTSADLIVREGTSASLRCAAAGSPIPQIAWRRESGEPIRLQDTEVASVEGSVLNISRVTRAHMGAYLCIASNGVPPTVSKRILLVVHFPPMIWIQNQLVGATPGAALMLECLSEAYPKSINYWTRDNGEIVPYSGDYEPLVVENSFKVLMKLVIHNVGDRDFGTYKCVSKNSLGDTDGTIKVYPILNPTYQNIEVTGKKKGKYRKNSSNDNSMENSVILTQDMKLRGYQDMEDTNSSQVISNSSCMLFFALIVLVLVANVS